MVRITKCIVVFDTKRTFLVFTQCCVTVLHCPLLLEVVFFLLHYDWIFGIKYLLFYHIHIWQKKEKKKEFKVVPELLPVSSLIRAPLELYHLMSAWPPVTLHSISALDPSFTTMSLPEGTPASASDPF